MFLPEPKFYLKEPSSNEPTLIYMQAKYSTSTGVQERFMLSSGNKIKPDEWDTSKQRAFVTKKSLLNGDINMWLDKMASAFKTEFRGLQLANKTPTATVLKERVEQSLNLKPQPTDEIKPKAISFIQFAKSFTEECKQSKAPNTIKAYVSTYARIEEFESLSDKIFSFEDITHEWRNGFLKYLQSLGVGRNTEGKHIKNVKLFMNEALERRLHGNMAFKSKSFNKPTEDVESIFLTEDEILLIANLDLSNDPLKATVRDYFVIACWTSLRYSDLVRLRKENIKGEYITIVTQKTSQEVIIPISPIVKGILEKYNFELPAAPCNQIFNRYLKDIGKEAGLIEKIVRTRTIGGVKQEVINEKWELLSSHVGRRSLVSNGVLAGMNTNSLMLITGHRSPRIFQKYVRVSQLQNAEALSKHAFFQ